MTSRDFCYWLQGYFEITAADSTAPNNLTGPQVAMVQRHLALVFKHEIDPSAGGPEHQAELNEIHAPKKSPPLHPGPEKSQPAYQTTYTDPMDLMIRC